MAELAASKASVTTEPATRDQRRSRPHGRSAPPAAPTSRCENASTSRGRPNNTARAPNTTAMTSIVTSGQLSASTPKITLARPLSAAATRWSAVPRTAEMIRAAPPTPSDRHPRGNCRKTAKSALMTACLSSSAVRPTANEHQPSCQESPPAIPSQTTVSIRKWCGGERVNVESTRANANRITGLRILTDHQSRPSRGDSEAGRSGHISPGWWPRRGRTAAGTRRRPGPLCV